MAKNLSCHYEHSPVPSPPVVPDFSQDQKAGLAFGPAGIASQSAMDLDDPVPMGMYGGDAAPPVELAPGYASAVLAPPGKYQMRYSTPISGRSSPVPIPPYFHTESPLGILPGSIVDGVSFDQIHAKAPRAFFARQFKSQEFSLTREYLRSTLSSFPYMILPGKTLPEFIHPQSVVGTFEGDGTIHKSVRGPLANCLAIMQMCSIKNRGNAAFIWRAIRMEQERLLEEVRAQVHVESIPWNHT